MKVRIRFLGTGAAEGIPAIGCTCAHCRRAAQEDGPLVRRRSAILFELPGYTLLFDAPPDIREMLQAYDIQYLDGIFLSHAHYDHVGGLREFFLWKQPLDLLLEPAVFKRLQQELPLRDELRKHFNYIPLYPGTLVPFVHFSLTAFEVPHAVPCFGLMLQINGQRILHLADADRVFSNYVALLLRQADWVIIHTPYFEPRVQESHMSVQEALETQRRLGFRHLVLTHINHHNLPHDELEARVARYPGVLVAYDGLELILEADGQWTQRAAQPDWSITRPWGRGRPTSPSQPD